MYLRKFNPHNIWGRNIVKSSKPALATKIFLRKLKKKRGFEEAEPTGSKKKVRKFTVCCR